MERYLKLAFVAALLVTGASRATTIRFRQIYDEYQGRADSLSLQAYWKTDQISDLEEQIQTQGNGSGSDLVNALAYRKQEVNDLKQQIYLARQEKINHDVSVSISQRSAYLVGSLGITACCVMVLALLNHTDQPVIRSGLYVMLGLFMVALWET